MKCKKKINNLIEENINIIESLELDVDITEDEDQEESIEFPDYDQYRVNTRTPHTLYENFRHKKPHSFEIKNNLTEVSSWMDMLIKISEQLYKKDSSIFKSFLKDKNMNGKKRANFTKNKRELRRPKLIRGTGIYIEGNKSSASIKQLIIKMLRKYGINISDFTVYLRADYTELHKNK